MTSAEQNSESVPVVEHFDEKSPERYRELLAAAVAAYGTDAVKVELRAADDGTVSFICTAKSKVDEYELARVVGETVKHAVSSIRHTELEEQVKRLEERIRELTDGPNQKVYVIEEAWANFMENHPPNAFGYEPVGFVSTESEASQVVANGGEAPECWATPDGARAYRYREVPAFLPRTEGGDRG